MEKIDISLDVKCVIRSLISIQTDRNVSNHVCETVFKYSRSFIIPIVYGSIGNRVNGLVIKKFEDGYRISR